jgi:acetyltransferase-like isoleucine patch superfamily enzyme
MLKIILEDPNYLQPFNERARDLRILNSPLWLIQRDLLAPYINQELELPGGAGVPDTQEACIVYRDNLYFDASYIQAFMQAAKKQGCACRAAFSADDPSFREHALPLSHSYTKQGNIYLADLWYYPRGTGEPAQPLVIDLLSREAGYYHVPTYMAYEQGDLVFQVPLRSLLAIDSWVHIFIADVVFGLFTRGARFEDRLEKDPFFKLHVLFRGMWEGKQVLECSDVVTVGNNVTIGAGAVIENCIIGDNVNISQDCQLMLSVVGDGAFLPFRSALFMTTIMDNAMVAQNTCLQMCVVGRNTFIGAGSTFTDYNLIPTPIRAIDGNGKLAMANRPVLGGCVGHNCRLGAGMIIFPARTIESDVVLFASKDRRVIERDVRFEDSDHHKLAAGDLHPRLYPRPGEKESISW